MSTLSPTATAASAASAPAKTVRLVSASSPLAPPSYYRPEGKKPPHWKTSQPKGFVSPWPSNGGTAGFFAVMRARLTEWEERPVPKSVEEGLPAVRQCTWVQDGEAATQSDAQGKHDGKLRYTWIGHAGCHLQIPLPVAPAPASASDGAKTQHTPTSATATLTVLTDPVLSERCSPFQFLGPKRYTAAPTSVSAMASEPTGRAWPDVVLLSHNHYDHCDYDTLRALVSRPKAEGRPAPLFVVPLGMRAWFEKYLGREIGKGRVVELDWWEERIVEVEVGGGKGRLRIVCTPAQHFSGRGLTDRDATLWASYALHVLPPEGSETDAPLPRIWFSGDTGYRTVPRGTVPHSDAEAALPSCPAFREIGALLGPFDLALVACGAYDPRSVFSPIHAAPHEAVAIHGDVRSRLSVGIHHSTFKLTAEEVDEPARLFLEEGAKAGAGVGFDVEEGRDGLGRVAIMEIGETRVIDVGK